MPCYHPVECWVDPVKKTHNGKKLIYHVYHPSRRDFPTIKRRCFNCIGCRQDRSRDWAIRCTHEASLWPENCFITLTYSPEHLPDRGSLQVSDFQKFMKRLRKITGQKIRFFHCGEYGEKTMRPHYHAIIFNYSFPDKKPWKKTKQNHTVYRSQLLEELWPFGMSEIGSVTFESTAYVARYIHKKINGELAEEHYQRVDDATGEIYFLKPEYVTMSRRPGIAHGWFKKFHSDVYPHDHVVFTGKKYPMRPPKYYDRQYEILDPYAFDEVKEKREDNAKKYLDDNTEARLAVKEQIARSRLKSLKRQLD